MSKTTHGCGFDGEDKRAIQDHEIHEKLKHIREKILVMSGKGGVGKSSVAAYLAVTLAQKGHGVGLMDVDLHGPSIPRMIGLKGTVLPSWKEGKIAPIEFLPNLHVISIEPLLGENKDTATIWRGPLKIGVIRQFISDVEWSGLDYLIIDSPPGTGDEPLTVAQIIPGVKALIVTTPQEISLADVRKSINFCRQVNMEILGLVENMSGMICPHCGEGIDLFNTRGGEYLSKKENLLLLGSLPFEPNVVRQGDAGNAFMLNDGTAFVRAFETLVERIVKLTPEGKIVTPREKNKEEEKMTTTIFAIPVSGGKLCAHFGHCDQFVLIETEDGEIKGKTMLTPPPHELGVLPRWLHEQGSHVIIAGGMGARAQGLFNENGIQVIVGAPGDSPESLVSQYLAGTLVTGDNICDH